MVVVFYTRVQERGQHTGVYVLKVLRAMSTGASLSHLRRCTRTFRYSSRWRAGILIDNCFGFPSMLTKNDIECERCMSSASGAASRSRPEEPSFFLRHTQSQIFSVPPDSSFRAPRSEAGLAARLKMQLAACAESGHAARAFRICAQMKHAGIRPDIAAYNWLLHACAKQGLAHECLALLEDMRPLGLRPDQETYNHVLFVCNFENMLGMICHISKLLPAGPAMEQELCPGGSTRRHGKIWGSSQHAHVLPHNPAPC